MGNKNTKPISSFADWEQVQTQNQIQIYKHKKNHQLAEKRSITLDPHYEINDQLKIYHMRQNNNDSLVKAFGAQETHKKGHSEGICSGHKKLEVLTQKILYRLSELPQLTFPQILLFLRESLRAYFRVFKSYGPIHITKKLIGINEFGQVRSWVNQNWALNHPDNDLPTLQSTKLQSLPARSTQVSNGSEAYDARYRDETEMVHNIVAVIEEKCEEGKFPQAFSEEVGLHSGSFRKLSTYIEDFIGVNELFIPPKINYQTVFVSKYQTRLVEQHRQSGQQQVTANQVWNGQLGLAQDKKIVTTTTIGSQNNLGFTSTGGYHQNSNNYGYGTSTIHVPQKNQAGYTVTKTTTYGSTLGNNNLGSSYFASYQPPTYQLQSAILSTNNNISNTTSTLPWQKAESIYKQPQAQSGSSSYQYSTTNPSSVGASYSYNFGGNSFTNGKEAKVNEPYKPSSYSSLFSNGLAGGLSYGNYSSGSLNENGNSSLENKYGDIVRFAGGESDNPLSPYLNLAMLATNNQRKGEEVKVQSQNNHSTTTANKVSYEEFKRNFNQDSSGLSSYQYSSMSYGGGKSFEPLVQDIDKVGSTFSFDGLGNYGTNDGLGNYRTNQSQYSLKGYSNTLASYNRTSEARADGAESNPMLGPLLKMKEEHETHLRSQNEPSQKEGNALSKEGISIGETNEEQA